MGSVGDRSVHSLYLRSIQATPYDLLFPVLQTHLIWTIFYGKYPKPILQKLNKAHHKNCIRRLDFLTQPKFKVLQVKPKMNLL